MFATGGAAISDALAGAERVRIIVRDLKLFSRSEDEARGTVDVQRMIDSTINLAWNEVRHRARLVKEYPPTRVTVEGNESQLSQVFLNLLVNAAQAIGDGAAEQNEIRLRVSVTDDGLVAIEVSDSGGGMTAEVQRQLFTPFFTTKPRGVGTGLGLSICQKIISAHGGEIQLVSELGKGTTFRVVLRSSSEPLEAVPATPSSARAVSRGRVLVIDDELMLGKTLRRVIKGHHDIEVVTSGRAALELLASDRNFDVIFCDMMMPEMAGPDLFTIISSQYPELAQRVVFLTGGAFSESAQQFLSQTRNLRIDKPFTTVEILTVVARYLQRPTP